MPAAPNAHAPQVVAIINTSPDTIALLRHAIQQAGFAVVTAYVHDIRDSHLNLDAFINQHRPAVIVWDLAPPYDAHWQFFQHIRAHIVCDRCQFVLTSPNAEQVQKVAGNDDRIYEVVGRSEDLAEVVRAVREAARARPVR